MDDGGWLSNALGEGWLLKVLAMIGGPVALVTGWIARRPLERAGVRQILDASMAAHVKRLDEHIESQARQLADERARCDAELESLRREIDALMNGAIATYHLGPRL